MHRDGDVTDGIMLRDGGQQECCFPSFCICFPGSVLYLMFSFRPAGQDTNCCP